MKSILLFLILLTPNLIRSKITPNVKKLITTNEWFRQMLTKFEITYSHTQIGPDISKLMKEKRMFFAELSSPGLNSWYIFENNQDIHELQMICHRKKEEWTTIAWYYIDLDMELKSISSSNSNGLSTFKSSL